MTLRTTILSGAILAIALIVAVGAGLAMVGMAHTPVNVDPVAPNDDNIEPPINDQEPPIDDQEPPNDDVGEPQLLVDIDAPDDGVPTGGAATITVTALHADETPAEGVEVLFGSLGISGTTDWDPGTEFVTDENGVAQTNWLYWQPEETQQFSMKPPSTSVTIIIEATIDDVDFYEFVSISVDMDYFADGCHSPGDPDIQ